MPASVIRLISSRRRIARLALAPGALLLYMLLLLLLKIPRMLMMMLRGLLLEPPGRRPAVQAASRLDETAEGVVRDKGAVEQAHVVLIGRGVGGRIRLLVRMLVLESGRVERGVAASRVEGCCGGGSTGASAARESARGKIWVGRGRASAVVEIRGHRDHVDAAYLA